MTLNLQLALFQIDPYREEAVEFLRPFFAAGEQVPLMGRYGTGSLSCQVGGWAGIGVDSLQKIPSGEIAVWDEERIRFYLIEDLRGDICASPVRSM